MAYFMDKYSAADKGFVVSIVKDQEIEAGGKKIAYRNPFNLGKIA